MTVERRYILIVAIALIAVAAGASVKPVRRAAASHRLYRSAMEDQAGAERLMQAGDTAAAIPLLRKAYVGFVDSGHTEAYAPMLVSISLAEEAVYHGRLTEYGYQSRVESARAAAADLLRQVAAERRRTREVWLFSLAALLLLAAGAALLLQRHRRLRLETERELLQARLELDSLHSAIPDSSTVIPNSPSVIPSAAKESSVAQAPVTPALTLALRSYEQLCSRYVPDGDNAALLHEFRQQLADMRDDAAFERELEESLSVTSPELLDAVRSVPGLKAEDRRLLRYLAAGLPTYMIGAILGKSRSAVNMQVSRLRSRIESLSPNSLLISLFDARHPGRPRR